MCKEFGEEVMLCKRTGLTFAAFSYRSAVWSADNLPLCPWCEASPYDADWEVFHGKTNLRIVKGGE